MTIPASLTATPAGFIERRAAGRKAAVAPLDKIIAFSVLLLMSKAIVMLVITGGDITAIDLADGSVVYQFLVTGAYAVCAARVLARRADAVRLASQNLPLLALIAVAVASTVWSVNAPVTLRRTIGLAGTTVAAWYVALYFRPSEFLELLFSLLTSIAVLSLLAVLLFPDLAIHSDLHAGDWRGVFTHKNNLGEAMALGVSVAFIRLASRGKSRVTSALSIGICGFMLAMSQSRASWVAAVVAVMVCLLTRFNRLSFWLRVPALVIAVSTLTTALTVLWLNIDAALALIGRDLTLTGRTVLWASAFSAGLDRPWLGYGYRAFWLGANGGAASIGRGATAFAMEINHGHNGFLDLWLEMGLVGLILFLVVLLPFARRAFRIARRGTMSEQWWPLTLLVLILPVSFATTVILDRNNYYWVIFVTTLLYLRAGEIALPAPAASEKPR